MSRCTIIKDCEIPGVEFNKPTDDIEDAIESKNDNIQYYKEKLKMLAACAATRPNGLSAASMMYHFLLISSGFAI